MSNNILKYSQLGLIIGFLFGYASMLHSQTYNLDSEGFARIRGDLHLFNSDDFTTLNLGFIAGAQTQYDTFKFNTLIGTLAGYDNLSGQQNTYIGSVAGASNISGGYNTFLGAYSGTSNLTGSRNTYLGASAGRFRTGDQNTCIGTGAGSMGSGDNNCFIGSESGSRSGAGFQNVCLGDGSGYVLKDGADNTLIGFMADLEGNGNYVNATALGSHAKVNASNKVRIGNNLVQTIEGQVNFSVGSDRRFKEEITPLNVGLDFIMDLNPVSYHRKANDDAGKEWGFIAQELKATLDQHEYGQAGMVYTSNEDYYYVRYDDLLAPIINAIQELKLENEELKMLIEKLITN